MPRHWIEVKVPAEAQSVGPGYLERVYETALAHALRKQGLAVRQQVWLDVRYEDLVFERAGRYGRYVHPDLLRWSDD